MDDQDLHTFVHTSSEKNSSFSKYLKRSHDSIVSNNNNYELTMNAFGMDVEVESPADLRHLESSHKNASFQTFVFFDTEATGIRSSSNKSRITELCLLAVSKNDLIEFKKQLTGSVEPYRVTPRVTSKINLCFNPVSLVMPQISDLTGLDNYNLEFQSQFSADTITLISAFLSHLPQPICLVAHNGLEFDFPLLKSEVLKAKGNFYADLLVVDSLHALKEIFDKEDSNEQTSSCSDNEANFSFHKIDWSSDEEKNETGNVGHRQSIERTDVSLCTSTPVRLESSLNRYDLPITPPTTTQKRQRLNSRKENDFSSLDLDFSLKNALDLPEQDRFKWARVAEVLREDNEATPDRVCNPQNNTHLHAPVKARYFTPPTERMLGAVRARKRLDFSSSRPSSFSLTKLHEYIFGKAPAATHGAEVDCLSLLRICASKAQPFIDYSEKNYKSFSTVNQMW